MICVMCLESDISHERNKKMEVIYKSTRDSSNKAKASKAILQGLARDGGLYVPETVPHLEKSLSELAEMDYRQVAFEVMKLFFTDFTEEELKYCINSAYDDKFDTKNVCELKKVGDAFYLELFHGRTIAFKDMALSILPYLLTTSAKKNNITDQIVILTATSGDTGKAALAGFADVPGTKIIVFYPKGGVSKVQEKQMVTQEGANTYVVGITGNFDDAQTGVKKMFNNPELNEKLSKAGLRFSSANSINIGRLIPQVAYYVYAYTRLLADGTVKDGEKVNFTVPTGNFGNILAAYYAKQIGVPVNKLICASNKNNVLTDFFKTGTYDKNRPFILTTSPSMDILISSNLERLIYIAAGFDSDKTVSLMKSLRETGKYTVTEDMRDKFADFAAGYAEEEDCASEIKRVYDDYNYVIDTHTSVASRVYHDYKKSTGDDTVTVIASTASPFKFASSVLASIDPKYKGQDDFRLIEELSKVSGVKIPAAVDGLSGRKVLHDTVVETENMQARVEKILAV
jgi:threonine synthase